jgi:hypothetical protein
MRSPLVFIFSGSKAPGRRKYVVRLWGDGVSGDVNGFGSLPRPRFSPRVMHGRACPCEALISGSSDPKAILSGPLVNTVIYPFRPTGLINIRVTLLLMVYLRVCVCRAVKEGLGQV